MEWEERMERKKSQQQWQQRGELIIKNSRTQIMRANWATGHRNGGDWSERYVPWVFVELMPLTKLIRFRHPHFEQHYVCINLIHYEDIKIKLDLICWNFRLNWINHHNWLDLERYAFIASIYLFCLGQLPTKINHFQWKWWKLQISESKSHILYKLSQKSS